MSNPHEITTVKCAHCGKVRQEANHWFVSAVEEGRFLCRPLDPPAKSGTSARPVVSRLKKLEEPACGQQCAQKLFERYLAEEANSRRHQAEALAKCAGTIASCGR